MFDYTPDRIPVYSKIVMDKDISHTDDIRPGNIRICGFEIRGNSPYRFPDNLEVVNNPYLCHLIIVEIVTTPGRHLFNLIYGFQDIQNPFPIVSHNARASLNTRDRIRPRRPASVTTSTGPIKQS